MSPLKYFSFRPFALLPSFRFDTFPCGASRLGAELPGYYFSSNNSYFSAGQFFPGWKELSPSDPGLFSVGVVNPTELRRESGKVLAAEKGLSRMKVITYNLFVDESGDQPSLQYGKGLGNSRMTLIGQHAESGAGADLYQNVEDDRTAAAAFRWVLLSGEDQRRAEESDFTTGSLVETIDEKS